jgi:hypothetical protein
MTLFTYIALIATFLSKMTPDQVQVTASTGIAAVNIGGITVYK